MPLSPAHPEAIGDLAEQARHAIEALFTAATYSDHRRARLAVRDSVERYVYALRAEGASREITMRRVAELIPAAESSSDDGRYVQALRAELSRWSAAAYDGR
jgi:hypothetical protein